MDHTGRVTKDVSARKTAPPAMMHTAKEMNAVKASHEAYLNSIIQGYEDEKENVQKEHESELAEIRAAYHAEQASVNERQSAAVSEAVRMALANSSAQLAGLQGEISKLSAENKNLIRQVEAKNKEIEQLHAKAKRSIAEKDKLVQTNQQNHAQEKYQLQEQLRKSWIKFTIKAKGLKTQTYHQRRSEQFCDAISDYKEKRKGSFWLNGEFKHGGRAIKWSSTSTLEELGIGDEDEIVLSEKSSTSDKNKGTSQPILARPWMKS